jgi:signal transduction histidine kinase
MQVRGNTLTITFADNGRGFVPSPAGDGDGLENMRRRLTECGGSCEIASAAGHGTTVTFTIPLAIHA